MDHPVDPDAARRLADQEGDAERADFLRRVADDAERMAAASRGRGAYARAGAGQPDPEVVASLSESLHSVGSDHDLVQAILAAKPTARTRGVDWSALGRDAAPSFLTASDPVLAALRELEPPGERFWRQQARHNQQPPPGDWLYWLIMAGRGFGKTWTGANTLAEWSVNSPGDYVVVSPTLGDARKTAVGGLGVQESGLVKALGDDLLEYNKGEFILYVRGGSRIIIASAEKPDRIRGLNLRGAWLDELASFKNARELWDEALLPALRIGRLPRTIVTTTPRRGNTVLTELLERFEQEDPLVAVTRGATRDNFENLSETFIAELYRRFAGTHLGRQELDGELLPDVEGALLRHALIELTRIRDPKVLPPLRRVVVGVDPSASSGPNSDHCGIVVVGIGPPPAGEQASIVSGEHLYFLEDASLRTTPEGWARRALDVAAEWSADAIVPEKNNGGDMVETMIRMVAKAERRPIPRVVPVWASVNKRTRAEPVAGVWQQLRAHVVGQKMPTFEDHWTTWIPGKDDSPDPLDAGVWGGVNLMPELAIKSPSEVRVLV